MINSLPLSWDDKQNSPELEAYFAQLGKKYYFSAEEINQLRDGMNEVYAEFMANTDFIDAIDLSSPAPVEPGIYIPTVAGTYANYGGLVVDLTNKISRIIWNGSEFRQQVVAVDMSNYLKTEVNTSITWNVGFFYSTGGTLTPNSGYSISQKIYVKKGVSNFMTSVFSGSMNAISFFDINNNYLSGITVASKTNYSNETFVVPTNANYFILSNLTTNTLAMSLYENTLDIVIKAFDNTKGIGLVEKGNSDLITGDTAFNALLISMKSEIKIIPDFFISTAGVVSANALYNYTDYIKINPNGNYYLSIIASNYPTHAIATYYDINKLRISSFNNLGTPVTHSKLKLTVPANAYYMRLSIADSELSTYDIFTDSQTTYAELVNPVEKLQDISSCLTITEGFFYSTLGVKSPFANYFITDLLEITNLGEYYLTMIANNGSVNVVSYYDADYNYISGISSAAVRVFIDEKLVIPAKARFFAFSNTTSQLSGFTLKSNLYTAIAKGLSPNLNNNLGFVFSTYFDVVVNEQTNIFLDNMTSDKSTILETVGSAIQLNRVNRCLRIAPTTTSANMALVLTNPKNRLTATATVRTISKAVGNGTVAKNILLIGDSLGADQSFSAEIYTKLNADADFIINQIGTKGTTHKHECISGNSWNNFIAVSSPFYKGGSINFAQYCTDNEFSGIDIVTINLGTNDIPRGSSYLTTTNIETVIANAKTLINAILASYPDAKISVGLQAVGAPQFPTANISADIFRSNMIRLNQAYVVNFDNGVFSANVTTHNRHTSIDREWSYQYVDENISTRNTNKWRKYTNDVHPFTVGYQEFADADYSKIRAFLSGLL